MTKIEDVFDKFNNDDIRGAKADLAPLIRKALNDKLKSKLELKENPIEGIEDEGNDDE